MSSSHRETNTGRRQTPRSVLMRQFEMLLQSSNANSGFRAYFENNSLYKWRVIIDGPPGTPYSGHKFTALLQFPASYPDAPPTLTFLTDILHPNVDKGGKVCISILEPPGPGQTSDCWNSNRSVNSILLSIVHLLAAPNFNSPANVDAAVLFYKDKEQYKAEVRRRVERASASTPRERSSSTPPPVAPPSGEQQQGTPQPTATPPTPPQAQEGTQQQ